VGALRRRRLLRCALPSPKGISIRLGVVSSHTQNRCDRSHFHVHGGTPRAYSGMSYSPPPSPPASAPPPLAPPAENNGIPIISLITPPSSPVRATGAAEPGSTSPQGPKPSSPSSPGREHRPAALEFCQPRQPRIEYPSTRASRRRADREAARWTRFVAAEARRVQRVAAATQEATYEGKGKGRAKAVGGASVGDVAGVAYLLNIWILGPVAPLTGQYSRGGLN